MKKKQFLFLSLAIVAMAAIGIAPRHAVELKAGGDESSLVSEAPIESSEEPVESSEEPVESSEEAPTQSSEEKSEAQPASSEAPKSEEPAKSEATEEEPAPAHEYKYRIKEAHIEFRDSETASYAVGDAKIGSYFLSADGWNEDDAPIYMTVKGNVTTKLETKIVYIYEYKPTSVVWNGKEVKMGSDKTYELAKPEKEGEYDLAIYFTKTLIVNPMDLTSINWASFLTVQNLMTIGSWAIIVVGILVLYFLNRKYKMRNATSLEKVQEYLGKEVESVWGVEASEKMSKIFSNLVGTALNGIDKKLTKMDNNNATMIRCLLLMQENTPEARLAITECLSKLDTAEDNKAKEVSDLIKAEMEKYKAEQEAAKKALEEAKATNQAWKNEVAKAEPDPEEAEQEAEEEKEEKPQKDYGKL